MGLPPEPQFLGSGGRFLLSLSDFTSVLGCLVFTDDCEVEAVCVPHTFTAGVCFSDHLYLRIFLRNEAGENSANHEQGL